MDNGLLESRFDSPNGQRLDRDLIDRIEATTSIALEPHQRSITIRTIH